MKNRSLFTEQVISALSYNQSSLSDIEARRKFHEASSDVSFVASLVKALLDSDVQWKSIGMALEKLLASGNPEEVKLVEEGVLETISEVLDTDEALAARVIPYFGNRARAAFELYESWHSPKPLASKFPKMGTEVRSPETEAFVKAVCEGQDLLDAKSLQALCEEVYELPDAFLISGITSRLVENPERADWNKFFETVEGFLENPLSEELDSNIYFSVFEILSISAVSREFDYKWVVETIGPKGRKMLISTEGNIKSPLVFSEFIKPKLQK